MSDSLQKVTTTRFTIQGIELDASGSVSPGWFSRILEHARWQVFAMDDYALRNRIEGGVAARARMTVVNLGSEGPAPLDSAFATCAVDEPAPLSEALARRRSRAVVEAAMGRSPERPGQLPPCESGTLRRLHR